MKKQIIVAIMAVVMVFFFTHKVFAEHIGDSEIFRNSGWIERAVNWPDPLTLEKGEKMIFTTATAFGLEKVGLSYAWVTAEVKSVATGKYVDASLNGRRTKEVYSFQNSEGKNMLIWVFTVLPQDVRKDGSSFTVVLRNRGSSIELKNMDFSNVPEICSEKKYGCSWIRYYSPKKYKKIQ